jgi:hypothetical protein
MMRSLLLLCFAAGISAAGDAPNASREELLRYRVRFGFIHLGTVEVHRYPAQCGSTGEAETHLRVSTDESLPFIDLVATNKAVLDCATGGVRRLVTETGRSEIRYEQFAYDPTRGIMTVHHADGSTTDHAVPPGSCDAVGLFMHLRTLDPSGAFVDVPTFVDGTSKPTAMRVTAERDWIEVPAFQQARAARRIEGQAKWVGKNYGGFGGDFDGWITDDPDAIPLEIRLKLAFGSIKLQLEGYLLK